MPICGGRFLVPSNQPVVATGLSRLGLRKTKAFDSMDELQFKGDIQQYQIEAVSKIQELFDSKANIVDYALSKVMKLFEGKSKMIQYRIANNINNTQDTSTLNIFDI